MKRSLVLLLALLLVWTLIPGAVNLDDDTIINDEKEAGGSRATLIVGPGQTYTKIQDAINAAVAGDTIRIYNGTYNENLALNKQLTLIGNSSDGTEVKGGGGDVLFINADSCVVKGLKFRFSGSGSFPIYYSGIRINSNYNHIYDCYCMEDEYGIGIDFGHRFNIIENCRTDNNYGGVLTYAAIDNLFRNCTFRDNWYCVRLLGNSLTNTLENCTLDSQFNGYGVHILDSGENSVLNCTMVENYNGIHIAGNSDKNVIKGNIFKDSQAPGIVIYDDYCDYNEFHYNNFFNNNKNKNQSEDSGSYSEWDYNHWSEWTDPDTDSNGIVDVQYNVSGFGGGIDWFPLVEPYGIPEFNNSNLDVAYEDNNYSVQYGVVDNNTDQEALVWNMSTNAPWLGMHNRTLFGLPTNDDVGVYWVNISVTDGWFPKFTNFTLEVLNTNDPPEITVANYNTTALEDEYYYATFEAIDIDPGEDDIIWFLSGSPSFLSLDPDTGELYGTPDNWDNGTFQVRVYAKDEYNCVDSVVFDLTVVNVNDPPIIETLDHKTSAFEDLYYYKKYLALDYDPTGDTFTWGVDTNANFLSMDEIWGELSGYPANEDVGQYWVNVTVSDGNGGIGFANFSLTVHNFNDAPVITTEDLKVAYEDCYYYVDYNATDVDPTDDTLNWSMDTDANFLEMNNVYGVLSGTPNNDDVRVYWVKVSVKDPWGGEDSTNFTLEVNNINDPPVGSDADLTYPEDCGKQVYNIHNLFFDMDGDILTFNISEADELEVSLTDPFLEFTPPANWNGWEELTITATDGEATASAVISIHITPVNDPPHSVLIAGVEDGARIKNGTSLTLTALVSDVDLDNEGDTFRYTWLSNISGTLGMNASVEDLALPVGHHLISLRVMDQGNVETHHHIVVIVEDETEPVIPTDDDDDDDEPEREIGKTASTVLVLAMILIPLIVTIIILILIILRSKEEGPPEDEIVEGLGGEIDEDDEDDDFDYDDEDILDEPDEEEFDDELEDLGDEDSDPFDEQDIVADEIDIEEDE